MIEKRNKFYFSRPDFQVSVLNEDEKGIHILVGPRFAPILSSSNRDFVRGQPLIVPYITSKVSFDFPSPNFPF